MKLYIAIVLLIALSAISALPTDAARTRRAPRRPAHHDEQVWQLSESAVARMGVRDKFGSLNGYDATFVVTGPQNKKTKKTVHVKVDEFKEVSFPDDFPNYLELNGHFKWTCVVNGKVVVSGEFSFKNLPKGGVQVTVPRNY
jgi:hypothetical protein